MLLVCCTIWLSAAHAYAGRSYCLLLVYTWHAATRVNTQLCNLRAQRTLHCTLRSPEGIMHYAAACVRVCNLSHSWTQNWSEALLWGVSQPED